jgi:hypothetical protein
MPDVDATTRLIVGIGGAVAVLATWLAWLRPRYKKSKADAAAIRDAILGRDAVKDSITGKELAPPLPGIGQRMATQETQMAEITTAVAQIAATHLQLARMDQAIDEHEERIKALEDAAVERVVTKAESAAAWRAMEAAALAKPDQEADPL